MDGSFSPDEIDDLAARAGLPLTPAWRDALIHGSRFVTAITQRLRTPRDLSAEPAHIFTAERE